MVLGQLPTRKIAPNPNSNPNLSSGAFFRTPRVIYPHSVSKENLFMLCSLLSDWNCFWNKYCNFPFLAICRSLLPLLIISCVILIKKNTKIELRMSLRNKKKMINYHIKGVYKTICYKKSPAFLSFSFLIDCCVSVFSLSLSKRLQILRNW